MPGYCDPSDVADVMQEDAFSASSGSPRLDEVEAAIEGVSDWLRRRASAHWYDSTAGTDSDASNDFLHTSARTASDVRLDVPSSPHRQDRQLVSHRQGVRYPVTHEGPYARIRLPHADVQSITALHVRERGGGTEDWTTATDIQSGRGEDYYLQVDGSSEYGTSYLYVRAASIGGRIDFGGLLTVTYDYGLDWATEPWESVRRGVAALSAADLAVDDDVKTAIPSDGQLIPVDTKADRYVKQAMKRLGPYLDTPIA